MRMLSLTSASLPLLLSFSIVLDFRNPFDEVLFILDEADLDLALDGTLLCFSGDSFFVGALRFEPVTGALTSFGLSMRACFVLLRVDAGIVTCLGLETLAPSPRK